VRRFISAGRPWLPTCSDFCWERIFSKDKGTYRSRIFCIRAKFESAKGLGPSRRLVEEGLITPQNDCPPSPWAGEQECAHHLGNCSRAAITIGQQSLPTRATKQPRLPRDCPSIAMPALSRQLVHLISQPAAVLDKLDHRFFYCQFLPLLECGSACEQVRPDRITHYVKDTFMPSVYRPRIRIDN